MLMTPTRPTFGNTKGGAMSNYPPGVSGNEIQITGPLEEWIQKVGCPTCETYGTMDCWWHPQEGAWATCPGCGTEIQLPDPDEPDPDEAYELMRDLRWERDNARSEYVD